MRRATNSGKVSARASSMIRDVRSERRVASPTIASARESATEMVKVALRGTAQASPLDTYTSNEIGRFWRILFGRVGLWPE